MLVAFLLAAVYVSLCLAILVSTQFTCLHAFLHYGKVKLGRGSQATVPLVAILSDVTVPKAWFAHFYVVYAVLLIAVSLRYDVISRPSRYTLVWVLLAVQAVRRLYECRHVTRWNPAARMHVTHYFAGLYFYVATPVTCAMGHVARGRSPPVPVSVLATALFCFFSWHQHRCHRYLASLRKYTAPCAGLFRHVSCPHYLDEMGIYAAVAGYACACGIQGPADALLICSLVFVCVNLCVSAVESNKYYKQRFPAYNARSVVPYLL